MPLNLMRFTSVLLLLMFFVCHTIGKLYNEHEMDSLCKQDRAQIDSIFMLSGDTFFKIKDKIWAMNSTKYSDPMVFPEDNWKTTVRAKKIEDYIKYWTNIDLKQQIFAFDYQYGYKEICSKTEHIHSCRSHSLYRENSYVCLYGSKVKSKASVPIVRLIKALSYSSKAMNFDTIINKQIEREVNTFCGHQTTFLNKTIQEKGYDCDEGLLTGVTEFHKFPNSQPSFALWQSYVCRIIAGKQINQDILYTLQFRFFGEVSVDLARPAEKWAVGAGDDFNVYEWGDDNHELVKNKVGLIIPIRFNNEKILLLNCEPNKCGLTDRLDKETFARWTSKDPEFDLSDDLTIESILDCPKPAINLSDDMICNQKGKQFDSVFMLSGQTFFKVRDKIWGLTATQFYKPFSFGEDLWNKTLRKYDFENFIKKNTVLDINETIFGFDYQFEYRDKCVETKDPDLCRSHLLYGPRSYVCLYGTRRSDGYKYIAEALSYEQQLYLIEESIIKETVQLFCDEQKKFMYILITNEGLFCDKSLFTGWATFGDFKTKGSDLALNLTYVCRNEKGDKKHLDYWYTLVFQYTGAESADMQIPFNKWIDSGIYSNGRIVDIPKHQTGMILPIQFKNTTVIFNCEPNQCSVSDQLDTDIYALKNEIDPQTELAYGSNQFWTLEEIFQCSTDIQSNESWPTVIIIIIAIVIIVIIIILAKVMTEARKEKKLSKKVNKKPADHTRRFDKKKCIQDLNKVLSEQNFPTNVDPGKDTNLGDEPI